MLSVFFAAASARTLLAADSINCIFLHIFVGENPLPGRFPRRFADFVGKVNHF